MQSKLFIDRGLKPKSRDNFYPEKGVDTYSFKIVVDGDIFYGMSYFGTKEAQEKHYNRLVKNWPDRAKIEVE